MGYSTHSDLQSLASRSHSNTTNGTLSYELDGPGSMPGVGGVEFFFIPLCPDWFRGPLSLLKNEYMCPPGSKSGRT